MEALENPYFEPGRRLLYKKGLTAKQLARLLYLDQANSFWSALYDVDSPTLLENPPYDLLEERDAHSLEYLNKVQFLLNWLRSFVIIRGQYETNAFIHLKTLETLMAESWKNDEHAIESKIALKNLQKLKKTLTEILGAKGISNNPLCANMLLKIGNGEGANIEKLEDEANHAFFVISQILTSYETAQDGFKIPDPESTNREAEEMGTEIKAFEKQIQEGAFKTEQERIDATAHAATLKDLQTLYKNEAERLEEKGEAKKALIKETFKQLTKYVLFLRGSRIVLNSIARVFKSTPDAWITRPERLEELEAGVRQILFDITVRTTRTIDGKRQTMEEAQAEEEAFEKMEGGPERLKLWEELKRPQAGYIEHLHKYNFLGDTASPEYEGFGTLSLWETKNFWRPLALKLKEAINKTWRPTDILKADTHAKAINFMGSQSDMDYIFEFCGIKE